MPVELRNALAGYSRLRLTKINPPLIMAEAWQASTAYKQGKSVANGGVVYRCAIPGTSAASGGPSGTGSGPITDGAVTWYCSGVQTTTAENAPTYSFAAIPAALTKRFNPVDNSSVFSFSGGVPTAVSATAVRFPAAEISPTAGSVIGTKTATNPAVHFYTDAVEIAINGGQPAYDNIAYYVVIDGVPLLHGAALPAATVNPGALLLTFSSRKTRRISVFLAPNVNFTGVWVKPADSIWPVEKSPVIVALGDSLTQGGNGFPLYSGADWPSQLGMMLGTNFVHNIATGGTGFISDNSGSKKKHIDRISDATAYDSDILIIGGAHNDATYPDADQVAAYIQYLNAFRSAKPNTVIIVFGTNAEKTGPSALMLQNELNLKAAVEQFNDRNCFFIPVSGDESGPWMYGTGKVTATAGDGNADIYQSSDGTHPTQAGIDYLAYRYARAIENFLSSKE